jgi:methylmalonyl-CoA mutase cobalamin-binding domain/chain
MEVFEKIASAVIKGDKKETLDIVGIALGDNLNPTEILNNGLRTGIEEVGHKFERMEIFLPEMIKSAKTMVAAIDLLRPEFDKMKDQSSVQNLGSIVIGTVQHDQHDIGKNIVSTFLDVSGFTVHDLGIDVAAHAFVSRAEELGANIIALSALLSTTVPYMKDVIKELELRGIRDKYKVLVGGGVVTQDLADKIGADGYAKDFVSAVQVSKELIG